jgi:hypothetical protein
MGRGVMDNKEKLYEDIGYIKGRVDMIVNMYELDSEDRKSLRDKVDSVQNKQHYQSGFFAAVAFIFGLIGSYAQKILSGL